MKKTILLTLCSLSILPSFLVFSDDSQKSNISITKNKYEIVIVDGKETRFETSTLKPVMIFEEVVEIKNISVSKLKSVVYDFKLDSKSILFSNVELGSDIKVLYSNNNGISFSVFPIIKDGKEIPLIDYTDIRMNIESLNFKESKTLKIRYSYDHFNQRNDDDTE